MTRYNMSLLSTGVLFALLLVRSASTSEFFTDYHHLRDVEISVPAGQKKLAIYTESGRKIFGAVLNLFHPDESDEENGLDISCTNHTETNKEISFAIIKEKLSSDGKSTTAYCDWYLTFMQLRMILLRGSPENKYNGSELIYWSERYNRSAVIRLKMTHRPTTNHYWPMTSSAEKNLSYYFESESLHTFEYDLELPFSEVTIKTHSNNIFSNGCDSLTGSLFRIFCLTLFVACTVFNTQDTTAWLSVKPFKLYIIWYSTFRLITWAYVVFWDSGRNALVERYIYFLYVGQLVLMVVLVRIRDPIVFYKKMLRCYQLLCFADYMILAACLSWAGIAGALFWYLGLFYAVPNLIDRVKDISEWKISISIAIEAVAHHGVAWPGNLMGIIHLALSEDLSKLKPLYLPTWFFFGFAAGLGVGVAALGCARYTLARRLQETEIDKKSKKFVSPLLQDRDEIAFNPKGSPVESDLSASLMGDSVAEDHKSPDKAKPLLEPSS